MVMLKWTLPTGIALLSLEFLCNNLVKVANGGFMPVAISKDIMIATAGWIPMSESTRLSFLADIVRVHHWFFSAGDLLGFVGLMLSYVGIVYWVVIKEINGGDAREINSHL